MAPSATQTETATKEPKAQALYRLNLGNYKEIDNLYIDREKEQGQNGVGGAKVCLLLILN